MFIRSLIYEHALITGSIYFVITVLSNILLNLPFYIWVCLFMATICCAKFEFKNLILKQLWL